MAEQGAPVQPQANQLYAVDWRDWRNTEDFAQSSIDNAAHAIKHMESTGEWAPLRQDELRAILCAIAPYSTVASRYLDEQR